MINLEERNELVLYCVTKKQFLSSLTDGVYEFLLNNNLVKAVKFVRGLTGTSIKDAKAFVDNIRTKENVTIDPKEAVPLSSIVYYLNSTKDFNHKQGEDTQTIAYNFSELAYCYSQNLNLVISPENECFVCFLVNRFPDLKIAVEHDKQLLNLCYPLQ